MAEEKKNRSEELESLDKKIHKESRPRGDFALTSQFLEYKKEILSLLQF